MTKEIITIKKHSELVRLNKESLRLSIEFDKDIESKRFYFYIKFKDENHEGNFNLFFNIKAKNVSRVLNEFEKFLDVVFTCGSMVLVPDIVRRSFLRNIVKGI